MPEQSEFEWSSCFDMSPKVFGVNCLTVLLIILIVIFLAQLALIVVGVLFVFLCLVIAFRFVSSKIEPHRTE